MGNGSSKEEAAFDALRQGQIEDAVNLWKVHQEDLGHCDLQLCDQTDHFLSCCVNHFHGRLLTLALGESGEDYHALARSLGGWLRENQSHTDNPGTDKQPYFQLPQSLSIGHPTIDHDHRYLARTINEISRALHEKDYGECTLLIDDFLDQINRHFEKEIEILENVDYPGVDEHIAIHNELRDKANEIKELGKNITSSEIDRERVYPELVSFLLDDAIKVDLEFKAFLMSNGHGVRD